MDVMFYEVFREEEEGLKRFLPSALQAGFTAHTVQSSQTAGTLSPPAPLIAVRTQSIIPAAWGAHLKGILTRSSGYDHLLEFERAIGKDKEIPCGYLPSYASRAVAEQVFLMILSLWRRLKKQTRHFNSFSRDGLTGVEGQGKNLLVVGVGHIGSEVVKLGRGVGMNVRGVDIVRKITGLTYVTLDEGLPFADVIVCALPLTDLTRGWLGWDRLRRAKPGALFVNVSRGEIAPVHDLKKLLESEILGGLGLDVYEDEGMLGDYLRGEGTRLTEAGQILLSIKDKDNVLFTPHNAFNTHEAVERKTRMSAESIEHFMCHQTFPFPIPLE